MIGVDSVCEDSAYRYFCSDTLPLRYTLFEPVLSVHDKSSWIDEIRSALNNEVISSVAFKYSQMMLFSEVTAGVRTGQSVSSISSSLSHKMQVAEVEPVNIQNLTTAVSL